MMDHQINLRGSPLVYIFFANDIVLMDETRSGLIAKLEFGPLEFKIFRLYTTKTKYKEGKFSKTRSKYKKMVRFDGQKIQKIKNF